MRQLDATPANPIDAKKGYLMPVLDFPFTWVRQDASGIVAVLQGMWLQASAYWWASYASSNPMTPLKVVPPEATTLTETFSEADIYVGSGFLVLSTALPPSYSGFTPISLTMDGHSVLLGSGHLNVVSSGTAVILYPVPDPSSYESVPTSITMTYSFTDSGTRQISPGTPGGGPDSAISPRGLVMFLNSSNDQMAALLSSVYSPQGAESIRRDIFDNYLYGQIGSWAVTLSNLPIEGTLAGPYVHFSNLQVEYRGYNVGQSLYALACATQGREGLIDITYSAWFDGVEPWTDSFTGDGSSSSFPLTYPILSLINVSVNGVSDPLASISGTPLSPIVNLSMVPEVDDVISVEYSTRSMNSFTESFIATSAKTVFTLSFPPIPETISVPDWPGNGFNFTNQVDGIPGGPLVVQPLVDGLDVRFAIQHPTDYTASASYSAMIPWGALFNIDGQVITEWDLAHNASTPLELPFPAPFDATPISEFLAFLHQVSSAQGAHWQDGWNNQRWGFLFYDPVIDGYTVVSPAGLYWRSRTPGTEENTHWTLLPWPEEGLSTDTKFAGYSYPPGSWGDGGAVVPRVPGLKRRTAPWMGVSVASSYALQGSWGATGFGIIVHAPENSGGGNGCPSDSSFPIRFFRRNDAHLWEAIGSISPFDLVADNSGDYPLYIPGTGIIHKEGAGGFATGRYGADPTNSWWPATRQATAWIMGCGWCESDWLADISALNSQANFTNYPRGLGDSGYTLNAVDTSGTVLSQLTFKCDPEDILNLFADLGAEVNHAMAHANDFIPNFGLSTAYVASDTWGYLDGYGYCYFFYAMTSVDGAAKKPKLMMPGIPALADGNPRYANDTTGPYGRIGSEDNAASQRIAGDGEDNFYLCLSVPYWARMYDQAGVVTTEVVEGTNNYTITQSETTHWISFDCHGYLNVPIISGVRDAGGTTEPHPTYNGRYAPCFPISGYITPYQTTFNYQVTFGNSDHSQNFYDGDGHYQYTRYYYDGGTLTVPWRHRIPHRTNCTLRRTYDWPNQDGAHFFALPGYSNFGPFKGAAVYDVVGDNRQAFTVNARTILSKVRFSNGALTEVWRKDVSHNHPILTYLGNTTQTPLPTPYFAKVYFTRPCGRFIFLLRELMVTIDYGWTTTLVSYLALEVWENTTTVAPDAPLHTVYLPNPLPDPLTTSNYPGLPQNLQMQDGVDHDGLEWALITGTYQGLPQKWNVQFHTLATASPDVAFSNVNNNAIPTAFNTQGMGQAADLFVWTENDGALQKRSGG